MRSLGRRSALSRRPRRLRARAPIISASGLSTRHRRTYGFGPRPRTPADPEQQEGYQKRHRSIWCPHDPRGRCFAQHPPPIRLHWRHQRQQCSRSHGGERCCRRIAAQRCRRRQRHHGRSRPVRCGTRRSRGRGWTTTGGPGGREYTGAQGACAWDSGGGARQEAAVAQHDEPRGAELCGQCCAGRGREPHHGQLRGGGGGLEQAGRCIGHQHGHRHAGGHRELLRSLARLQRGRQAGGLRPCRVCDHVQLMPYQKDR